jgi:Ca2+-binding EF-hand superfamily protein
VNATHYASSVVAFFVVLMSLKSVRSRRSSRPSTAASEDTVATTVEIIERATSTLQGLRTADALQIWRALGLYVQDQLAHRRPVRVDQFGVFGLNESIEPVFLTDAAFLQANRLRERERHGQVLSNRFAPVARVNAQLIGAQYLPKCRKEVVAAVIANVVALVAKWAKQGHRRGLRLGFLPVGEWQCDSDGVVSFLFLAEFRKHLRLGTTAVTVAQIVDGTDIGRKPSSKASTTSRPGSSQSPSACAVNSTGSKRTASAGGSRCGTLASRSKCRESVRDAEHVSAASSSSGTKSVRSLPPSALSQRTRERESEASSKSVRPSTAATSVAMSTSSRKTTTSSRQAWADPRSVVSIATASHLLLVANVSLSARVDSKASAIFARIRSKLTLRYGPSGLNALERALGSMVRPDGNLSRRELKFGLRDLGVEVSGADLDEIASSLANGQGHDRLRVDSIMLGMRGVTPLPDPRRALIEQAFRLMDVSRKGFVSLDDLKDNYDVSTLPKVRAGKQSTEQALTSFLREWEPDTCDNNCDSRSATKAKRDSSDGGISLDNFVRYYHVSLALLLIRLRGVTSLMLAPWCLQNVSACVDNDSEFERMMHQMWHVSLELDDDEHLEDGECASPLEEDNNITERHNVTIERGRTHVNSPSQSVGSSNQDGDEAWQYLEVLLLPKKWSRGATQVPTLDAMCHRVGANRILGDGNEAINTRAFAHALRHLDKQLEAKKANYLASLAASTGPNQTEQGGVILLAELYKVLTNATAREKCRVGVTGNSDSGRSSQVIDKVRQRLLRRVANSASPHRDSNNDDANVSRTREFDPACVTFHGLARSLRLMDTDGDRRLSKDELKTGLRKFGVDINFHEVDCLFAFFDTDESGCISCDEFITGMRGEMSERRLSLVRQAFGLLDADGDGQVTLNELQAAYDCSKHPEVISGKISAEDAIKVFASQWETNQPDGIITRDEFETYYKNLSASIDSDDYFELMMRNAWHISGGDGQCANSTNRRVLLTDAAGAERVVEIRNDLGIKSTDFARMRANLQEQGLLGKSDSKVESPEINLHGYADHRGKQGGVRPVQSIGGGSKVRQEPDRRFHRRSQFAQPDSRGRSVLAMAETNSDGLSRDRETQRALRDRAAELIQSRFRGFRARKLAALVRRKMAAEQQRRHALAKEQNAGRRRVLRAATRTVHGF